MDPLHPLHVRAVRAPAASPQAVPTPAGRRSNADATQLAALFTTQLHAAGMAAGMPAADDAQAAESAPGFTSDALTGSGSLGAMSSLLPLGQLAGLGGGLGALAGMPGIGVLAGLGGFPAAARSGGSTLQGPLLATLLQAVGSAGLLGGGMPGALATPSAAASAGANLVEPPSASLASNVRVVADSARRHGVPPDVAVAMMLVESGGDSRAVGDGGTSFGLFQLHEGGMLTSAGLSKHEAFDPRTNADVAMRSLASYMRSRPGASPGEVAAASQRPADPAGYARKVDAMLARARSLLASA